MNELGKYVEVIEAEVEDLDSAAPRVELLMKSLAMELRREFCERDQGRLDFQINIKGDPHKDLEISYGVGQYGVDVKGNSVLGVVREFFRRKGWDNMNRPQSLTYSGETKP